MVQNISSVKILHLSASRFRGAGIATVNLCKYLDGSDEKESNTR